MSLQAELESPKASGPRESGARSALSTLNKTRRFVLDRWTRRLVVLGGGTIIFSILAIFFVILAEVYPLFLEPRASVIGTIEGRAESKPLALGVDEYREVAYLLTSAGLVFVPMRETAEPSSHPIPGLGSATVAGVSQPRKDTLAVGLSDGRVVPLEIRFSVSYDDGKRSVVPEPVFADPILIKTARRDPIQVLDHVRTDNGAFTAALMGPREVGIVRVSEGKALVGPATREEQRKIVTVPTQGSVTALVVDNRGENLFAGTSDGQIVRIDLRDAENPNVSESVPAASRPGAALTVLGFLLGDRTLVAGDAAGGVSSWQLLEEGGERRLARMLDFAPHAGPVTAFSPSRRDKGFLTADASGVIHVNYGTTGKTLLETTAPITDLGTVIFAPKADGFVAGGGQGRLAHFSLHNPHPEITLASLFGKLWYEGYGQPEYVWQSTGGTDDFEAKFSLTPLLYGTLKGTFYALLFAVPLALLGALYTSQFMHPSLRNAVKPTVEIMAALPSVVLGFIAGLWLAPKMEKVVPGIFLLPVVIPGLILLAVLAWHLAPPRFRRRVKPGMEIFLLVPVVLAGGWASFALGGVVEAALLSGDYRSWLQQALGLTFDQRNSLVVGFAMGFAVIPIIFTIAEDSLSSVPRHLVAGSLALGATPWQTALRIVLPTASPGIFSAVMIGFGRAVGETMIVLMATGNTPVMDWSVFNGFRALSANIAVELPEAPEGGTLYRILFLAALLLFLMTFIVNTAAEMVRLRLRRKYQSL